MAGELAEQAAAKGVSVQVLSLAEYDFDSLPEETAILAFVVATYEGGVPAASGRWFFASLESAQK